VPLGRKWPSGLSPVGPVGRSPPTLPGLDPKVKRARLAFVGPRWARAQLKAQLPGLDLLLKGYGGYCSASRRAARSRACERPGGGDVIDLEKQAAVGGGGSPSLRTLRKAPGLGEP
jgi:hypothetical protein